MTTRSSALTVATLLCLLLPGALMAQELEGTMMLPSEITLHDVGWSQIANLDEVVEFFFAVVETLVFTAAFAFHPRANAVRQDAQGWLVQASMFLFAFIGMLVGFLVVHHGYLIGFVIFGLGSLFRFRMASSSLIDGAILIMVTLVGLAVGLNLPVMALIVTVAGAVTLWFVTVRKTSVVELKFKDDDTLRAALGPVRDAFAAKGFRIVSTRKSDFKPVVEFVLSHTDAEAATRVPEVLDDLSRTGHSAKDWHVA